MHVSSADDALGALIEHLEVPCCMGFAVHGPGGCNCWEPVYDLEQNADLQLGPAPQRVTCCSDCAYRNGSPEREEGGDQERDLIEVTCSGVFVCHVGMRRVVEMRHPSGAAYVPPIDHYDPPQLSGRAWRADGRPAELCAGWAASRRGLLA